MQSAVLPPLTHASLRLRITNVLRKEIVEGRLKPGDRLVEADLSERLRVSRGPVREALQRLEQEGLVVAYPYRGTEVLGVSQEELGEILVPIRVTLERFAFRHALPRLTEADLAELASLIGAMRTAAQQGDLDGLAEADVRFHELVIARADRPHCAQIWGTIEPRVRAHFRRDAPAHASPHDVVAQHEALLAAIRTRDPERVLPAVEEHIRTYLIVDRARGPAASGRTPA